MVYISPLFDIIIPNEQGSGFDQRLILALQLTRDFRSLVFIIHRPRQPGCAGVPDWRVLGVPAQADPG